MQNNIMPRKKTSIVLPFDIMDEAGTSWTMLVVMARFASECRMGIIPDEMVTLERVGRVYDASVKQIRTQAKLLCDLGLIMHVTVTVETAGNGWSKSQTLSGWRLRDWDKFATDSRRMKTPNIETDGRILFGEEVKQEQVESDSESLRRLTDIAQQCMVTGGRNGRKVILDYRSTVHLKQLLDKHGFDSVKNALEKSAGANRPVAMAKSILSKGGKRSKSNIPDADEWRRG